AADAVRAAPDGVRAAPDGVRAPPGAVGRPAVEALLLLADVARDDDERRRALERALSRADAGASPQRALVLARLGDVARDQHRDSVALDRWREALAADPACWPASLALAEEEQGAGLPSLALSRLDALRAGAQRAPRVQQQRVRLLGSLDRHADEERLLAELARSRRQSVEL